MGKKAFIVIGAFLCVMLLIGCKPSVPRDVIQPDVMEDILFDYYLSREMASKPSVEGSTPYLRTLYYNAVLKKYGVTEAEFDSSLVYYYGHAEDFAKIYSRVNDRMVNYGKSLGVNSNGMTSSVARYTANGDTANIWHGPESMMLTPVPPYNRFDIELKADTSYRKGDSFMMSFNVNYLYQQGSKDATAYLAVMYSNDSIASFNTSVSISGYAQLRVPECMKHDIKSIRGFVYLNRGSDESETVKLMFIDDFQFIRFHRNESKNTQNSRPPSGAARRDEFRQDGGGAKQLGRGDSLAPVRPGRIPNRVGGGNDIPIQRK